MSDRLHEQYDGMVADLLFIKHLHVWALSCNENHGSLQRIMRRFVGCGDDWLKAPGSRVWMCDGLTVAEHPNSTLKYVKREIGNAVTQSGFIFWHHGLVWQLDLCFVRPVCCAGRTCWEWLVTLCYFSLIGTIHFTLDIILYVQTIDLCNKWEVAS